MIYPPFFYLFHLCEQPLEKGLELFWHLERLFAEQVKSTVCRLCTLQNYSVYLVQDLVLTLVQLMPQNSEYKPNTYVLLFQKSILAKQQLYSVVSAQLWITTMCIFTKNTMMLYVMYCLHFRPNAIYHKSIFDTCSTRKT